MSAYQLNKILYMADNDHSFLKLLKEAPDIALRPFRLSEAERNCAVGRRR